MSIGKLKIIIHRLIWFLLLFAGVICFLIQLDNIDSDNSAAFYSLYFIISYCDIAIALPFFIGSLFLSCKKYRYNGSNIVVYAGWFHHYLKMDGEVLDEHNTFVTFTAIVLSCTLNDGTRLQATISLTNRIALKINDRLYKNK